MESSEFSASQSRYDSITPLGVSGGSCDTFCVKLYGKLHFLKRLKSQHVGDVRYQEAFRKEFETGYRLEHPHLVRYVSLEGNDMLLEYVDGETLTQRLASQPDYFKNKKNTAKFVAQLLDVVGYLHAHQVVHLDLKPDNIMLTRIDNDVKLIDLGCCYTDTFADTSGRTNSYAAPEQLSGGQVDARTDIYAIGKILSTLPSHHIYNKVATKCMSANPRDRYQSVDELRQALSSRRPIVFSLAASVSIIVILGFVLLSKGCASDAAVQKTDTEPTVIATPSADTPLLTPAVSPAPTENVPAPKQQEDKSERMKKEMVKLIDKAYKATIASFCDSVFPSPSVGISWKEVSTDFYQRVNKIGDKLTRKYPEIPEMEIRQEIESRFQNIVGYVFGRMRENGQQIDGEEEIH